MTATTTATAPRALRTRLRGLLGEAARFATVGLTGTAVNFLVFNLCVHAFGMYPVRSSVVATLVAIGTNYLGYRFWVYRDRARSERVREMTLFLVFSLIGLVIENGVLYATHYWGGWDTPLQDNVFKFLGMGMATVFRFASYRTWVFRKLAVAVEPAASGPAPERTAEAAPEGAAVTGPGGTSTGRVGSG